PDAEIDALGCYRVTHRATLNFTLRSLALGLRGCLRRFRWKSSHFAEVCEVNTDLSNVFQICSSNAFGLASSPVSLKPSRPRPLPVARNESRAFAESLRAVECVRAGKNPSRLGDALFGLSARSLGMVERLIPNSEQCVLCRSGR